LLADKPILDYGQARPRRYRLIIRVFTAAFAGWAALLAVLAVLIFSGKGDPAIGREGAFLVFGIVFSAFYFVDFVLLAIPGYFILRRHMPRAARPTLVAFGGISFGLSSVVWSMVCDRPPLGDLVVGGALGAVAGSVALLVMGSGKQVIDRE
jgi:hypothetical protein